MELIQTSARQEAVRFDKPHNNIPSFTERLPKENKMTKNYQLMNRKTNKLSGRKFWTREEARIAKRNAGFKHAIVNLATGDVIR